MKIHLKFIIKETTSCGLFCVVDNPLYCTDLLTNDLFCMPKLLWTASAWSLIYSFSCYSKYCSRKLFQGPQTWLSLLREGLASFLNDLWCYWICDEFVMWRKKHKQKKNQPLLCIFPSAHPGDSRLFLSSFSFGTLHNIRKTPDSLTSFKTAS